MAENDRNRSSHTAQSVFNRADLHADGIQMPIDGVAFHKPGISFPEHLRRLIRRRVFRLFICLVPVSATINKSIIAMTQSAIPASLTARFIFPSFLLTVESVSAGKQPVRFDP